MTKDEWYKKVEDYTSLNKKHHNIYKLKITNSYYKDGDYPNGYTEIDETEFVVADNFDHARELAELKPRKGYVNIKSIELICNAVEYDV